MSATKCDKCGKSIYPNDPQLGDGGKKWHKQCFKCSVCNTLLVLRNAQIVGGVIYCDKDKPTAKPTAMTETLETQNIKNKPKISTVNQQVRGELAGQKSQEGLDSIHVGGRLKSGQLAMDSRNVNQNVRGELAGQKSQEGLDSIGIGGCIKAGQLASDVNLVNEQIRGELAGQKSTETVESIAVSGRIEAGRLAQNSRQVNENIRGSAAGQQKNLVPQSYVVRGEKLDTAEDD